MKRERKTIERVAKNGNIYYYTLKRSSKPIELTEKFYKEDEVIPVRLHDKTNPAYLRYVEKKIGIKREYPRQKHMNRREWLEYIKRILDLVYSDADFQQWREETKTQDEIMEDKWWEEKKLKESQYDGRNDEYTG